MQTILLLHGAIGSKAQLHPLATALSAHYNVYSFNFSGHGGRPFQDDFSMPQFVDEVRSYQKELGITSCSVFGYSMGGYVGMLLAKQYPDVVENVITLGTKFHWDAVTAVKETAMLNADVIEQKVPKFAVALAAQHGADVWKTLLARTADMLTGLGTDNVLSAQDYPAIQTPALILRGADDAMVPMDETVAISKALPNAQLHILPHTPHQIEKNPVALLVQVIRDFVG